MTVVNGIEDPDVMCPGGHPETFHVGPHFGGVYPCSGDLCIAEPLWGLHVGATEMWCAKTYEEVVLESTHVPIAVPEVDFLPGIAFGLLCAAFMRWLLKEIQ